MLKLVNIKKNYKVANVEIPALKGVSLEFRQNEFVSILGPSGCGKTTLLNIIGGLDRYSKGDLIINNKSTKNFKDADWDAYRNHSIGFVFQNYNLIPHLSILGNVEIALTLSGVSAQIRSQKAKEALIRVGLIDHLNKKPNQLSGGQMQRVAIARALVNDPEILLADEPTGALDTKTSIQIMDLIQEISHERLVIMVTHNPELAEKYSSRTIKLLDGEILDDTNPYDSQKESVEANKENKEKSKKKTSMSFFTALSLSTKNLFTKKFRTIITSFAGSIGIIGIALVLSLSNGFSNYINKMQADTLSGYPLTISESSMDIEALFQMMQSQQASLGTKFPTDNKIFVNALYEKMKESNISNKITEEYVEYVKQMNSNWYYDIIFSKGIDITHNVFKEGKYNGIDMNISLNSMNAINSFTRLGTNTEFINSQYDLIYGNYPTNKNQLVVVVDQYNRLSDMTLMTLGIKTADDEVTEYSFDDILKIKYKLAYNDDCYIFNPITNTYVKYLDMNTECQELEIVGILRPNEVTSVGALVSGVCYTSELQEDILTHNLESSIVKYMLENPGINPITGEQFEPTSQEDNEVAYEQYLRSIGGKNEVNSISIYAKDFESKIHVKEHLDAFNVGKERKDQVIYSDVMEIMINSLNTMVDIISYVLIAFTAISLLVSSVMISIITYVSVVERTKEIGVLRSVGARKKDISRVFNAETFMIGLVAGTFGVLVTYILNIPINIIVGSLVEGIGQIASLNVFHALILIVISIALTLIAGLFPSRIAANKDPVVALRSE